MGGIGFTPEQRFNTGIYLTYVSINPNTDAYKRVDVLEFIEHIKKAERMVRKEYDKKDIYRIANYKCSYYDHYKLIGESYFENELHSYWIINNL
jgi:hypothetical protein